MSKQPESKARKPRSWQVNAVFAAVVLLIAGGLWLIFGRPGASGQNLVAVADFGMGAVETIPLDADYDYYYEAGGYIVHLQVKDGAIAFLDSQCPDHVCEDFGWLSQEGQWACCVPAGVYVSIEEAA